MARTFGGTNGTYGRGLLGITATLPVTMACWFRAQNVTTLYNMMAVGVAGASDQGRLILQAAGNVALDPVRAFTTNSTGTTNGIAVSTAGYTANTWFHACGVYTSTTSRAAFCNGTSKGTNTTNVALNTLTAAVLGSSESTTNTFLGGFLGDLADAAVWNVDLTDAQVALLATGVSPIRVRPDALIGYWRVLGGETNITDWWQQGDLAVTGSVPDAQHPNGLYYPSGITTMNYPPATPPAALILPAFWGRQLPHTRM
jgi:hypothetical protein